VAERLHHGDLLARGAHGRLHQEARGAFGVTVSLIGGADRRATASAATATACTCASAAAAGQQCCKGGRGRGGGSNSNRDGLGGGNGGRVGRRAIIVKGEHGDHPEVSGLNRWPMNS
jgi:hypothetical protein